MALKNIAAAIAGIVLIAIVLGFYALLGAISLGTTAVIIAGGLHFFGFIGMGLAKAIFLGVVAVGAIFGAIVGLLQMAVLAG